MKARMLIEIPLWKLAEFGCFIVASGVLVWAWILGVLSGEE